MGPVALSSSEVRLVKKGLFNANAGNVPAGSGDQEHRITAFGQDNLQLAHDRISADGSLVGRR
jgi:hypothetical protein